MNSRPVIRTGSRATGVALAAVALAMLATGTASADDKTKPHSLYAQGKGPCLLTHEVSLETKKSKPGLVILNVLPRIGFTPGNGADECESTLRLSWKDAPGGQITRIIKSPVEVGNKPQTFEIPMKSGEQHVEISDNAGTPGPAKVMVRVL